MTEYSADNRSRSPTLRRPAGPNPTRYLPSAVTATAAEWTLQEDLRIWGPPDGYLGDVIAVAADSRDNIYILDGTTQEIQVFDAEGGFLRTLGGQGQGPGEFREALGPAIAQGDTLWVADGRAPRHSIFAPDGRFIGTQVRRMTSGMIAERCTIAPDGSYMEWWTRLPMVERSDDMPVTQPWCSRWRESRRRLSTKPTATRCAPRSNATRNSAPG